jgi:Rad3-related DNA helicase
VDDYGVVVFLDIRVAGSQYYAKQIRSSLPDLDGSSDIRDIEKWLDSKYPVR